MFTYKSMSNDVKKVCPFLGLKEALVIEEYAITALTTAIGILSLVLHDNIMTEVSNDLEYVLCNRVRNYVIERPKRGPLGWQPLQFSAAMVYCNAPEKLFDPLWLQDIQEQKQQLEEQALETRKLMQENNEKGISKEQELERRFDELIEEYGPLSVQAAEVYKTALALERNG